MIADPFQLPQLSKLAASHAGIGKNALFVNHTLVFSYGFYTFRFTFRWKILFKFDK